MYERITTWQLKIYARSLLNSVSQMSPAHISNFISTQFFGRFFSSALLCTLKLRMFWCANATRVKYHTWYIHLSIFGDRFLLSFFSIFLFFRNYSSISLTQLFAAGAWHIYYFLLFFHSLRSARSVTCSHTHSHIRTHGNCNDDRRVLRHRARTCVLCTDVLLIVDNLLHTK